MSILWKIDLKSVGAPPCPESLRGEPQRVAARGTPTSDVGAGRRRYLPKIFAAAALAFAAFAPSPVLACAACYGKSDSALASGMNWGILTLLAVVLTVLTCIALFFVHIVRKEEAMSNPPPPPADQPVDL